jgi:hypothetical protein
LPIVYGDVHITDSQVVNFVGIGYNGFPRGCSDDSLPWAKVGLGLELMFFHFSILNSLVKFGNNLNLLPCSRNLSLEIHY